MKYKRYSGTVELDEDAGLLYGTVIGTRDVIHYEGETVKELRQAFEDSINDYLEMCAQKGREPDRPPSGKFVVRLGQELHRRAVEAAVAEDKSLNAWIAEAVRKALKTGGETDRSL